MSASLDSIYQSLNSSYQPQRDLIGQQIQALPGQYQAQQQGLDAQKNIAFQGVDNQANSRGMLYSGVPTQEDNNYIAANYLPAKANLANQQNQQQYGLQSALNNIGVQQQQQAFGQYNTGIQNDMTQNNLNQQIELAKQQAAMYAGMYGKGGSGGGGTAAPNINTDLQGFFTGFSQQPKFYTEKTVIPQIAQAYYGGNQQAAAKAVYAYRKSQFGS